MSSQLDRAFVKAYTRSHRTPPPRTTAGGPHLKADTSIGPVPSIADMQPEGQASIGWRELPDDSYFRVDVGHSQALRSKIAPLPASAAESLPPQALTSIDHLDASFHGGASSIATNAAASPERLAEATAYAKQTHAEAAVSPLDEVRLHRQWMPPAIEEPQAIYRVQRDVEQAAAFARAKMETLGRESLGETSSKLAAPPTAAAEPATGPTVLAPAAAAGLSSFEAVWEVDALEFSDTIVALFGDARLMKSIGGPLDRAVATGLHTLLITSATRGEGRTSVAIGIAVSAAAAGLRVALVDADTGSVGLADALRMEVQHDWIQAIRNGAPLDEVAIRSIEDQLIVMPVVPGGVQMPYTAQEFDQMLSRLRESFDLVIVDGTPWLERPHALQQTTAIDAAIVVVDTRNRSNDQISRVQNDLRLCGVTGLGIVENFA